MSTLPIRPWPYGGRHSPREVLAELGVDASSPERLARTVPFAGADATCGVENELQAVVAGPAGSVDLPRTISGSAYYQSVLRRSRQGELPRRALHGLERWLADNPRGVWENSWVRLPAGRLGPEAAKALEADLAADKRRPEQGRRGDAGRFVFQHNGETWLRLPVSYLLKLALVEASSAGGVPELVRRTGRRLAEHFLCDNTSPETFSFHVVPLAPGPGSGRPVADETARRFLLTQLLVQYAGLRYGLAESGQRVSVYFAPHPPVRQKALSELISDSFYRELFMNPCLSGWDRGEDKHRYMHLCHQVLSRAQLNALGRLREAGIVLNNLVVLPCASNISLANNGTHVSLGSRMLSRAMAQGCGFGQQHQKYLGDLCIKFVEHFLPLFVGTYSAAPYRLDFRDFHPERVLSFLPYELDYTHLRMIWRRWRKKARLKLRPLGVRLTPFGPPWLDGPLARVFRLRGDVVPDFRLLDYLVAVMSTESSPALDGLVGNIERLKADLAQLGGFDPAMPAYLPYRLREFHERGFSGFEGRHYSQFHSFDDLARASELQTLLTALAFTQIADGRLGHDLVPDDPTTESERRQVFFGAAIGLPTFFVRERGGNLLMRRLVGQSRDLRPSRRYPGYTRVKHQAFRRALWGCLKTEGAALVEAMGLGDTLEDLGRRLTDPEDGSAHGRLLAGILSELGAGDPFRVDSAEFNQGAEAYYRGTLRGQHLREALAVLSADLTGPALRQAQADPGFRQALGRLLGNLGPEEFLDRVRARVLTEAAEAAELSRLIHLLLLVIEAQARQALAGSTPSQKKKGIGHEPDTTPIHRAG